MNPPNKPPHDGRLEISGVSLTMGRIPNYVLKALICVKQELEPVMEQSGYLHEAPFSWVTLVIRFGLKNEEIPHYLRINKKYGDLPLAIEVDVHEMIGAPLEELHRIFRSASLRALIHAGEKYGRPTAALKALVDDRK